MSDKIDDIQAKNIETFMKRGPGLSYSYEIFVIKRDPSHGRIYLGGLGGMGVGQMWFTEQDWHKDYAGYAEAEIVSDSPDPWSLERDKTNGAG